MKDEPHDIHYADVNQALHDGWGIRVKSATYVPLGSGSYHWVIANDMRRPLFITLDDFGPRKSSYANSFEAIDRALSTAWSLRHLANLDFVVAPIPTEAGDMTWRLRSRYAISVFPAVDGKSGTFGKHRPQDVQEVVQLLVRLHDATPVVANLAPQTNMIITKRKDLEDAMENTHRAWSGGTLSESARLLLVKNKQYVSQLINDFDQLVKVVLETPATWVVTHGEPHPGNIIRNSSMVKLVDWDTVQIAPAERDLWMLTGDIDDVSSLYSRESRRMVSAVGINMYRVRWHLSNIANYIDQLRSPHYDTADTRASLEYLRRYLEPSQQDRLSYP